MDRVKLGPVKGLRIAVAAFVLSLVLLFAVGGVTVYVLSGRANEGSETHDALCALAGDYEGRVSAGRTFLRVHPEGLPGIASASQIRESLLNQERTLAALSVIDC